MQRYVSHTVCGMRHVFQSFMYMSYTAIAMNQMSAYYMNEVESLHFAVLQMRRNGSSFKCPSEISTKCTFCIHLTSFEMFVRILVDYSFQLLSVFLRRFFCFFPLEYFLCKTSLFTFLLSFALSFHLMFSYVRLFPLT